MVIFSTFLKSMWHLIIFLHVTSDHLPLCHIWSSPFMSHIYKSPILVYCKHIISSSSRMLQTYRSSLYTNLQFSYIANICKPSVLVYYIYIANIYKPLVLVCSRPGLRRKQSQFLWLWRTSSRTVWCHRRCLVAQTLVEVTWHW